MSGEVDFEQALARFGSVPKDDVARLLRSAKTLELPRGAMLVREGEPTHWLGFLNQGLVRIFCNRDGREVNLGFELEGGFVGDYAAYMQAADARNSQETLEPSRLLRFDRELLDRMQAGSEPWRDFTRRAIESELVRKLEKEIEVRTASPEARYEAMLAAGSPLLQRVPQYHLASYLGITPETLSRIRARRSGRRRS